MTRKDYVAIAQAIKDQRERVIAPSSPAAALDMVADAIADYMSEDNPRFDCARFLKACGVQS